MTPVRAATLGLVALAAIGHLNAQIRNPAPVAPFEQRSERTVYNFLSFGGVPISSTKSNPPGSNGRAPTPQQQEQDALTPIPSTPRQFQGSVSFGALAAPRNTRLNANASYVANAGKDNLDLPRGTRDGQIVLVMPRARVGAPWLGRQVGFLYGSVIPVPSVKEDGTPFTAGLRPEDYWFAEPHRPTQFATHEIVDLAALAKKLQNPGTPLTVFIASRLASDTKGKLGDPNDSLRTALVADLNQIVNGPSFYNTNRFAGVALSVETQNLDPENPTGLSPARLNRLLLEDAFRAELAHTAGNYYWSPHARSVYAIQPGPVDIVWKKAAPTSVPPADYASNPSRYSREAGNYYTLNSVRYIVSGSPVKPPRKIYWTEKTFAATGKPVVVPAGRVPLVNVVYNNGFQRRVDQEYQPFGTTELTQEGIKDTRTLWFEKLAGLQQIKAYNLEGRVFVELLGDTDENKPTRRPLGFEIVDVLREPQPADVTIELGERLTAFPPDERRDDSHLDPDPIADSGQNLIFRRFIQGSDRSELFAIRETRNKNDVQVHWLEQGLEGVRWPSRFVRYAQVWPTDVAKYSHYVRPLVATEAEARATAVPLPAENAPLIDYQDPLDQPRGKLTETFAFYTFLSEAYPAHRALLRFSSGEYVRFERVFSWLDTGLKEPSRLSESVAGQLSAWDKTQKKFNFPNSFSAPRVVSTSADVGRRIEAPADEPGVAAGSTPMAGHLHLPAGNAFNPGTYLDPFVAGFEAANLGAILPVNVVPGKDTLEVWWFRRNQVARTEGFKSVQWPSVIGRYRLRWPENPSEIVLASNDGSGPLASLEAKGRIYYQNDRELPGYNPNEEHALMLGGQAFALRDDLNITTGPEFSSEPYVLLDYTEADGRPAMRVFHVLREKPSAGQVFNFTVAAGTILQAPMPLPLMEKPLAPKLIGAPPRSLNQEVGAWAVAESKIVVSNAVNSVWLRTTESHGVGILRSLFLQASTGGTRAPQRLLVTQVNYGSNTMTGVLLKEDLRGLTPWTGPQPENPARRRFRITEEKRLTAQQRVILGDPVARRVWGVQVMDSGIKDGLPFVDLQFAGSGDVAAGSNGTLLAIPDPAPTAPPLGWRLAYEALPTGIAETSLRDRYASFTLQDRKGDLWVYRGPHDGEDKPDLAMQFYYGTLPGFYFPSLAPDQQPPVGTITPYLRATNPDGSFAGDPVFANRIRPQTGDGNALEIHYAPVWPNDAPILQMAETLTLPKRGLPQIRGQSSLEVAYQQSQVANGASAVSVVLHDPTREKIFALRSGALEALPGTVRTQEFRGKTYFPNLPPHLSERFYLDPTRGDRGSLVFRGEFKDEALGEDYLLLNVLGANDLTSLKNLCLSEDPAKAKWDAAVNGLTTQLELFVENPAKPGTYRPSPTGRVDIGPGAMAAITDDDVAVDSYALTAVGPGSGYVSLISGNGLAFTPAANPVSVQVIRVVDTLYRGEVKVLAGSNPLSETLTLQQVVDLAGKAEDYRFEWKIAPPVDGLPPAVYETVPTQLMGNGTWNHLRFPLPNYEVAGNGLIPLAQQLFAETSATVAPVNRIPFVPPAVRSDQQLRFNVSETIAASLVPGNAVVMRDAQGVEVSGTVSELSGFDAVLVRPDSEQASFDEAFQPIELYERAVAGGVQSVLYREFNIPSTPAYSEVWLSLDLDPALGAQVYLDGQLAVTANRGDQDTPASPTPAGLSPLSRVYRLDGAILAGGSPGGAGTIRHVMAVALFSTALPDAALNFNVRLEANRSADVTDRGWQPLDISRYPDGIRALLGGNADVRSLADNYVIMRYQAKQTNHASFRPDPADPQRNVAWSAWTRPQLAEGWIKRVLGGINPFNQRVNDLLNNSVNTDASILQQAGARWEGDVALNLDTINQAGLIEIYETVLSRGKKLSIGGGINFGPANDALLLAAGYLNDLYMMLGNEAWADAANPTIGIGTKDRTYGEIATALFAFRGQLPSLLEEELALLRGRDDSLLPGVELRPVYNRLPWNYTRGIDAGEVVYALNYNILDLDENGRADADDARRLYPQGHGDAYGHYLTAVKGYYGLLMDTDFDWVPRIEAVSVLGQPVSVDYQDERKFAAAAGALARAGKQVVDLTWRRDYQPGAENGWGHLGSTRVSASGRTRSWGVDHWSTRTAQGAFLNWVVGNAILPDRDPDPSHEGGIQQIDRTTVTELAELPSLATSLQTTLDNAESRLTPLGLPETTVPFDINPTTIVGGENSTHFEQIYERSRTTLGNALAAFDDAKNVTRLMRSEADSLSEFRTTVNRQELAYTNQLIELYGTPYPEDIGPGRTYRSGFAGPDTIHYMYVETPELSNRLLDPAAESTWRIDTQTFRAGWVDATSGISDFNFITKARVNGIDLGLEPNPFDPNYGRSNYVEFTLSPHGFFQKPAAWTGRRSSPGRIQQAISDIIKARNAAYLALYEIDAAKGDLDWAIRSFERKKNSHQKIRDWETGMLVADTTSRTARLAYEIGSKYVEQTSETLSGFTETILAALPNSLIAGLAAGGDLSAPARAVVKAAGVTVKNTTAWGQVVSFSLINALEFANETSNQFIEFTRIAPEEWSQELRDATSELRDRVYGMQNRLPALNQRLQELDDAKRKYQALVAEGDRIAQERQIFRQRAAAVTQGYRTRDAAFRIFRNEKLERYKTLFDTAAQYAFLSAQAFDYETGLLQTPKGRQFLSRIVQARALGVMTGGEPQFAGSNTGDPGLSGPLAEMRADWLVLKGRLGFNNPDAYGTTVSLRTENLRILSGTDGDQNWKDALSSGRKANLLEDPDIRRYCLQLGSGQELATPGLVISFSTTIADGVNLFGHPLAGGDHAFSPSSFATKIHSVGVALEGYQGMDTPNANASAIGLAAATSPADPSLAFLNPNALSATPYVYLIPVGVDSMRSPPLGDQSVVRSWTVDDVAIPLPFNIGASDFSSHPFWQSGESLTEPLFTLRKHQAFRPVSSASLFPTDVLGGSGQLVSSQFTNRRLIGRSVWNSQWKLVIPGRTLLSDPNEGLDRFIQTVKDVKLRFVTYSYSGN